MEPETQSFAASLKAVLLEPLLIVGAGAFWLAVLPVTGVFCASVALYDKVVALKKRELRLPNLRHNRAQNPLVLRRTKNVPQPAGRPQAQGRAQA